MSLLKVEDLHVSFYASYGDTLAVRGVSFSLSEGESIAIVGETGSGKSVTAQAIMGLLAPPGKITGGSILFDGHELAGMSETGLRRIRGRQIGMVFQDPMSALNPTMTIGSQIMEGMLLHLGIGRAEAKRQVIELLSLAGIPNAAERFARYPHEFSGGMRQRVMVAMALACQPKILIADEPTSALDVATQAQLLSLIKKLQRKLNTAIILITHDLSVAAALCTKTVVMHAGQVVESGDVQQIFGLPRHPYTLNLLSSTPRPDGEGKWKLAAIRGNPPVLSSLSKGCAFAERCGQTLRICTEQQPPFFETDKGHYTACWLQHPYAANQIEEQEARRFCGPEPA